MKINDYIIETWKLFILPCVFDKIKAFVEPQITSLNNVTSDIVRTMVQSKLQSLSNMTSHMIQRQQNRTTQTFNSLIKARSPNRNKTQLLALNTY